MVSLKVIVMLAVLSGALALPAGTLPRVSKERVVVAKEEPVAPARDYAFNYDIQDGFVGMTHSRSEVQRNGIVRGFYRYSRPDGVLVTVTYTADETGFHPVITEEAAPNLFSPSAVQTMYSSDNPEQIKITLTEDDVDLTRQKAEAAKVAGTKLRTRVQSRSETNSQLIDQKDSRFSRMLIPVKIPAVNSQTRFNYYE
ncbi:hypothetical protein DAPPUDRAFT_327708 [Daphnia pulex]|uniref:Cuticular protein n=1 Tax=Daphnia pulex TaxID=6669 RepID=E9HBG8_DAPPU|nr:hypothetical protein DAPPUDRAFT_327708 [Daphnia pulex]|eukprot:EFX70919.1 hypothetical protein DAPPUDRAFT_327708 [Daphnia pulex]